MSEAPQSLLGHLLFLTWYSGEQNGIQKTTGKVGTKPSPSEEKAGISTKIIRKESKPRKICHNFYFISEYF